MDVIAILNANGTIPINIALIVVQLVLIKTSLSRVTKEFEDHKALLDDQITTIKRDMSRNDEIFRELQTNMTKVLVSLEFIQETLQDLKGKNK